MPRVSRAAVELHFRLGQLSDLGSLQMFKLLGRHVVLQLAVGQKLTAVCVGGVVVDSAFIHRQGRGVEKAFRPDIPVANRCKQRSNHCKQHYLANLFAQHRKLYR